MSQGLAAAKDKRLPPQAVAKLTLGEAGHIFNMSPSVWKDRTRAGSSGLGSLVSNTGTS